MGNNFFLAAFTDFEFFTITCYNEGILDKDLLKKFIEHYKGTYPDKGGMTDMLTDDGMNIEEVVVLVSTGKLPKKPTHKQKGFDDPEWEKYFEELSDAFDKATKEWDWD